MFTRADGSPIHPDLITDWFRRLARAAGLPPIRLHDVRHSYATAALAAGVPAKVISERLGHATIAITLGCVQPRHSRHGRPGGQRRGQPDPGWFRAKRKARTEVRALH